MSVPATAVWIGGIACTPDGAVYVQMVDGATSANPTFTGTADFSTADRIKGGVRVILDSGIPLIKASSGSIGNNGALTALTALPFTYASAYIHVPAGAIAAGVPASADWYYVTMSSTQAGTIYNNTLSANLNARGEPTIPATPTAFVTTGPGAFTGSTSEVFPLSAAIPAGAMSVSGQIVVRCEVAQTNNANAKSLRLRMTGTGGTAMATLSLASFAGHRAHIVVQNRGAAAVQYAGGIAPPYSAGGGVVVSAPVQAAIDTSAATTAVLSLEGVTATDNIVVESCVFELVG